jgi:hypothetical protein
MIKAIRTFGVAVLASGGVLIALSGAANAQPLDTHQQSAPYKNCTAAWDAGAAPVHRGDPGYGPHLDRDDDGIGCEYDPRHHS